MKIHHRDTETQRTPRPLRAQRGQRAQRRRSLTLAVLIAAVAMPAMGQTVVSESNITGASGQPARGWVRVWAAKPFTAAGGARVDTVQSRLRIVNGQFAVSLWPNDTSRPAGTYYMARWQLDGGAPRLEYWYVPTCGTALTVVQVQACVVGGAIGSCGLNVCGGGGGNLSWTHLTNAQWTGMTNGQWTGMGN